MEVLDESIVFLNDDAKVLLFLYSSKFRSELRTRFRTMKC